MYQVVIGVLVVWLLAAFGLSAVGLLPYTVLEMFAATATLAGSGLALHYALSFITKAPANLGSTVITLLILFFIFDPSLTLADLVSLAAVAAIAIVSKYVVAFRGLHIFNPVALAAVLISLVGLNFATWWIATPLLAPLVLLGGILITAKIRRFPMVVTGIMVATIVFGTLAAIEGSLSTQALWSYLVSTPLLFFMFVMVTEPLTTPAGHKAQVLYGALIAGLLHLPFTIGPLFSSPELALLVANAIAYPFSLKGRLKLALVDKLEVAANTIEYQFKPSFSFWFKPGQYLEWALPHSSPDTRGIRRYFTIASSPQEEVVRLTVRHNEGGSTFKKALAALKPGEVVFATSRKGEFVLPRRCEGKKLLFVAGGIGVTPFRSHIQHLIDTEQAADVALYYCNQSEKDIAYRDFFAAAESEIDLKTIYVLDQPPEHWSGESGYINEEMLQRHTPDVTERIIYISGPPPMVNAYKDLFLKAGVPRDNIHTDYFPGLA